MNKFRYLDSDGKPVVPENFNVVSVHLDRNIENFSDKVAIFSQDQTLTYRQLDQEVSREGNALRASGVKNGDVIVIALPDTPRTVSVFLGAMKIGAVPAIVNPTLAPVEMKYVLEKSGARFLSCSVQTVADLEDIPRQSEVLTIDGQAEGCIDYQENARHASNNLETFPTCKTDPAYVVFSSGTTGTPKAVLHLHKDLLFTAYPFIDHVMHATSNDIYYSGSRLFFSAGRMFSLHLPLMSGASTVLVNNRPTPEIVSDAISRYKPTVFLAIPSLYSSMMRSRDSQELSLNTSSLRLCLSGGEPLPPSIFNRWKELTGMEIISAIGSSEAEWHFISQFPGAVNPNSAGRIMPGWEVKLVDEQKNQITRPHTLGTAWIKSGSVAAKYLNDIENTEKKFVDGWFITDDVFYFDEEGYYYFVGRNDNLFKVKGRWVSPIEVEKVMLEHPQVSECIAFCATSDEGLNETRALIISKERHGDARELAQSIILLVSERLPDYKTPREVGFVDSFERTGNGKIKRTNLVVPSNTKFYSLERRTHISAK